MPKAINTPITSRRRLLAGSALGPIAAAIGIQAPSAAAPSMQVTLPDHSDADLIRICAEHLVNRRAFNNATSDIEYEDDPLWVAYERTRREIDRAKPTTLEGLRAKARAAKAEAMMPRGRECSDGGPPQAWAWDLVNDLLAMGDVA